MNVPTSLSAAGESLPSAHDNSILGEPSGLTSLAMSRNNSIKNLQQIQRRTPKPFDSKNIDGSLKDLNERVTACESNDDILSKIDEKLQEQIENMSKLMDRLVSKINQASGTTNVTNVANFGGA